MALRHLAEEELDVPARLRDYQWDGVAFLYRSQAALLADEMGLGKTVQTAVALALLLRSSEVRRVLIVTPSSLTTNWISEIASWAPSLTVRRVQGTARERENYYLLPIPVLVASYEQIRRDALDRIPTGTFDLVVLDEAQRIKNRASTTALACRLLPRSRAWALTATPLENSEDEVRSILDFLLPLRPGTGPRVGDVRADLDAVMLRRRKGEVMAELPPVLVQDVRVELSPPQRKDYDDLWARRAETLQSRASRGDVSVALLGLLTRLKLLCNFDSQWTASSKMDLLRLHCDSAGPNDRILVFSQFVKTLEAISDRLSTTHDLLTGSMSLDAREHAMDCFRTGPPPRALLVSLRAAGVGLNLGEATHVVLFDRWWNPAVEVQAIYRAHRFRRREPLHVSRFLVADSIEERIAGILDSKEQLFDDVVESAGTRESGFTLHELLKILELNTGDLRLTAQGGTVEWRE